jgi:hypothetical protein
MRTVYTYKWIPRRPSISARVGPAGRAGLELVGLLMHALPAGRIGGCPGGDAPPAGQEAIQGA